MSCRLSFSTVVSAGLAVDHQDLVEGALTEARTLVDRFQSIVQRKAEVDLAPGSRTPAPA